MARGKQGSHWGSFAGGFSKALLDAVRIGVQMQHYQMLRDYMEWKMNRSYGGRPPPGVYGHDPGAPDYSYGGAGDGGGGGAEGTAATTGKYSVEDMVPMAEKAGFKGEDAAHIAAIAAAESNGNPNAVGGAGEIGLTQINPHSWPPDMVRQAHDPQGAFDAAHVVFEKQGWGAWSTDPSSKNFTPNNSYRKYFGRAKAALTAEGKPAPADVAKVKEATGKEPAKPAAAKGEDIKGKPPEAPATTAAADQPFKPFQVAGLSDIAPPGYDQAARLAAHRAGAPDVAAPVPDTPSGLGATGMPREETRPDTTAPAEDFPRYHEQAGLETPAPPDTPSRMVAIPPMPGGARTPPPPNTPARMVAIPPMPTGAESPLHDRPPVNIPPPPPEQGPPQRPPEPVRSTGRDPRTQDRDVATMADMPTSGGAGRIAEINAPLTGGATDERRQPADKDADKPSKDATPVSATKPAIPSQATPGVMFTGQGGGYSPTQSRQYNLPITVADWSHGWGANPPVQRGAPTPQSQPSVAPGQLSQDQLAANPPMPPPRPAGRDLVIDDAMATNAIEGADILPAARKGGPIRRYAQGGAIPSSPAVWKLAGGGNFGPIETGAGPPPIPNIINANNLAQYGYTGQSPNQYLGSVSGAPYTTDQFTINPATVNTPLMTLAQNRQADVSYLNPTQTAYYNQLNTDYGALMGQPYGPGAQALINQMNALQAPSSTPAAAATPAAATPAPTAPVAAPTPVPGPPTAATALNPAGSADTGAPQPVTGTDTTGTTTGAFNLPNTLSPNASWDITDTGGTNYTGTQNTGGTNYNVDTSGNTTILSARGGAIPSRPTLRFAAGGPSPSPVMNAIMNNTYAGPLMGGGWRGTPYSQLAPNQQAWADQQTGLWNQIQQGGAQDAAAWGGGSTSMTGPVDTSQYMSQLSMMPDAIWPTAAAQTPAAPLAPAGPPTPVPGPPTAATALNPAGSADTGAPQPVTGIDNTTTGTTTGAFNLPNTLAPSASWDTSDTGGTNYTGSQNTGGTNYNVDTSGNTTILSRRGGPIRRYDAGGDVSPSIAGMPPGLSGGTMPIPPIYYNPATYAGAGAPVGKGVSQTSAPTYVAGAIPSLPMMRGGVVKFDDGGDVMPDTSYMDMRMIDDEGPSAAPKSEDFASINPQEVTGQPNFEQPPQGATAVSPQYTDNQGNPSRNWIDAIGEGLHHLGGWLGIGGAQAGALASDAGTQTGRMNFSQGNHPSGEALPSDHDMTQLNSAIDPENTMDAGMRNGMRLEAVRNWYVSQGNYDGAAKTSALIMQKSVELSQRWADQAYDKFYRQGDLQGVASALTKAKAEIADGTMINASVIKDANGNEVGIRLDGHNLLGKQLWAHELGPQQIAGVIHKMRDGSAAWTMYEAAADKYAPDYKERTKREAAAESDRRAQRQFDYQQQSAEASEKRRLDYAEQIRKQQEEEQAASAARVTSAISTGTPQSQVAAQPAPAAPASAPASTTPASPAPAPVPGGHSGPPAASDQTAGAHAPPSTADQGAPPALPGAGIHAIPAVATRGNVGDQTGPQPILDQTQALTHSENWTPDGYPIIGGKPVYPATIDWSKIQPKDRALAEAQLKEANAPYEAAVKLASENESRSLASRRGDITAARTEESQTRRMEEQEKLEGAREGAASERTQQGEQWKVRTAALAPREYKDVEGRFITVNPETNARTDGTDEMLAKGLTAGGVDTTGKALPDAGAANYANTFKPQERLMLGNILHQGYYYTKELDAPEIADAVAGIASNRYHLQYQAVDMQHYGYDRGTKVPEADQIYTVSAVRPQSNTITSFRLTGRDLYNLQSVQQEHLVRNSPPQEASPSNVPQSAPLTQRPQGSAAVETRTPLLRRLFGDLPTHVPVNPPPGLELDPRHPAIPPMATPLNDDIYSPLRRQMPLQ